jgi:Protein of unknown function (DUF3955)
MVTHTEKILKLAALLLLLGVVCLISFKLIGSTVDESGFLHEPFMLVIIGWFLIGVGIISFIFHCIIRAYQNSLQN